jgi:hypothetical protein
MDRAMIRKFKIGETVKYRLMAQSPRSISGVFTVTGFVTVTDDEPVYRLQDARGMRSVAREHELYSSSEK